jgi:hypothetical protein
VPNASIQLRSRHVSAHDCSGLRLSQPLLPQNEMTTWCASKPLQSLPPCEPHVWAKARVDARHLTPIGNKNRSRGKHLYDKGLLDHLARYGICNHGPFFARPAPTWDGMSFHKASPTTGCSCPSPAGSVLRSSYPAKSGPRRGEFRLRNYSREPPEEALSFSCLFLHSQQNSPIKPLLWLFLLLGFPSDSRFLNAASNLMGLTSSSVPWVSELHSGTGVLFTGTHRVGNQLRIAARSCCGFFWQASIKHCQRCVAT